MNVGSGLNAIYSDDMSRAFIVSKQLVQAELYQITYSQTCKVSSDRPRFQFHGKVVVENLIQSQ
jgi:hypothetical protein